jgi:hypothetical protein
LLNAGARLTCKRLAESGQLFEDWHVGDPIRGAKRHGKLSEEESKEDEEEEEEEGEEEEYEDDHHGEIYLFQAKALTPKYAAQVEKVRDFLREHVRRLANECRDTTALPVYAASVPADNKFYFHDDLLTSSRLKFGSAFLFLRASLNAPKGL